MTEQPGNQGVQAPGWSVFFPLHHIKEKIISAAKNDLELLNPLILATQSMQQ